MPRNLEKVQKYHQPAKWAIIFRANLFILLLQVCYIFGSPPDLYLRTLSVSTLLFFSSVLTDFFGSGNVFPINMWDSLKTKNHFSCKQNQTLPPETLSVVHPSASFRQHYSSIWSLPGKIDFWGQLSFKTTTKMWHFSYLKQNNHRSCQLGLRK